MKNFNEFINESLKVVPPVVEDGKVKVIILYCPDYVDDNLELMMGMNRVCVVWTPEDSKGSYMCANGGISFNDGKQWTSVKEVETLLGNTKFEEVDIAKLSYSYYSTVGGPKYNIKVFAGEVSKDDMDNFYKLNGKSLTIYYSKGYTTTTLSSFFKKWREKGYLSK